ncbi:MAG: hypothetical protein Q8N09_05890 [Thermodesulfovibrionia bacterium]|nr:hypothetical protein [Thermodesulfovibrionia bacterium]
MEPEARKMIGNSTYGVNKQQVDIKMSFWLVQNLSLLSLQLVCNHSLKKDSESRSIGRMTSPTSGNDSGEINAIFN